MTASPTPADRASVLVGLAERCDRAQGFDNAIDVQCEIALFEPNGIEVSIRTNDAGTKVIVTYDDGSERTFAAQDFTISGAARTETSAALRARAILARETDHG